jgi:hypothetical protein
MKLKETKGGWYCVLRYCPSLAREEFANTGVLVVIPGVFSGVMYDQKMHNARARFGRKTCDVTRNKLVLSSFASLVSKNARKWAELGDEEGCRVFCGSLGNSMQMSPPRKLFTDSPEQTLAQIYNQFVEIKEVPDGAAG